MKIKLSFPIFLIGIIISRTTVLVETVSVLEAMAMELPVVLSDIGGAREMVEEGINGFIFPPRDIESLAGILEKLIKDPKQRHLIGINARKIIEERFSLDKMAFEYKKLIDE